MDSSGLAVRDNTSPAATLLTAMTQLAPRASEGALRLGEVRRGFVVAGVGGVEGHGNLLLNTGPVCNGFRRTFLRPGR